MYLIELDISFCATYLKTNKSNIPLINIYEPRNILLRIFKLLFHKYIPSIYLEETEHSQAITNKTPHMCILTSNNYTHFHATYIKPLNNTKEPFKGTAVYLYYYHYARSRNLFQCILYIKGQLTDYKSICFSLHTIIELYEIMCQFQNACNGVILSEKKSPFIINVFNHYFFIKLFYK